MRVLIACPHLQREMARFEPRLAELGIEYEAPWVNQQLSEAWLLENIDRFDGLVAGDDPYTAAVIAKAARLKVIAKWGIGMDSIDRDAAAARGIAVLNTPGQLSGEVADVTIGYMIMLARRLHQIDASVRAGAWSQVRGISLAGKTLGIVGLGAIGKATAKRALGHEMQVLAYDPYVSDLEWVAGMGIELRTLHEMLPACDFVALNSSLTPETYHIIGKPEFELMKPGAYLVNTSRGPLIDEPFLVEALSSGRLAGAALDVFEVEPLAAENPLRGFENCIFGSHNSSNTQDAVDRINEMALANMLGVLLKERQWAA
jgi:D-3-phosphoglycerate dehydrogenase